MTQIEWFEKNGFNEKGETFAVVGNSYSIKDKLKELGYKYNSILGWHGPAVAALPTEFSHIMFHFEDMYKWDDSIGLPIFFPESKKKIERAFADAIGTSSSQYLGVIGNRLNYLDATYLGSSGFSNNYGYTYIHNFDVNGDILIWFTTKELPLEKGAKIFLSGTVKKHEEYKGAKTTILTRCIIRQKEIA